VSADLGEVIVRSVQFTDANGNPIAPDAPPTYTVTLPDGTAGVSPSVIAGGTGEYYVNYVTTTPGLHLDFWTGSISGLVSKFAPDSFNVRSTAIGSVISLAEVRRHLRIYSSDPERDEELRDFLDTVIELCEAHTNRTYRRQVVTESHDGGKTGVLLFKSPVQSITSVTENGSTVAASGWFPKLSAGVLYRGTPVAPFRWLPGIENVTVTYVAGAPVVSAKVRQAVKVALAHLWAMQRGGSGLPGIVTNDGTEYSTNAPAWSLPREVEQLLDDDIAPGFA
jgi:hypothetical protein